MKKEINRCMGCMNEKLYDGECEICGYIDNSAYPDGCLEPRTFLADRYVIGKLISINGEGGVYLAFDTVENKAVEIKEFMPDALCVRNADGETVDVREGCLPLYKSYLSEFADLHKTIMTSIEDDCMKKIYGIFAANNTGYVVMEHVDGMSLSQYLENNGNIMRWDEVKSLFPPIFEAINKLHLKGIVHRGISSDTVIMTKSGRLMLTAIGISAARTADSRINCEMHAGYAACEQYSLSERQGSWTDVYGVCAVLYRVLTGRVPPEADSREVSDTLTIPLEVRANIPLFVSEAIADGMKLDQSERIHNIKELTERLYPAEDDSDIKTALPEMDDGPVTPVVAVRNEPRAAAQASGRRNAKHSNASSKSRKKKNKEKKSYVGTVIGLIIFFALVIALVVAIIYFSKEAENAHNGHHDTTAETTASGYTVAVTDDEPAETTTATVEAVPAVTEEKERLLLPNFVDRFYNTQLVSRYSMLNFEVEYDYSDYSEGIIYEQDIPANTQVTAGTAVKLKVSKGRATANLPDYIGMKIGDYKKKLDEEKIKYEVEEEETGEVKEGYVVRCSREVGESVNISDDPETVTVYVAVKPAETEPPETEPPVTEAPETSETTKKTKKTESPVIIANDEDELEEID